jgi:hypothetical protein
MWAFCLWTLLSGCKCKCWQAWCISRLLEWEACYRLKTTTSRDPNSCSGRDNEQTVPLKHVNNEAMEPVADTILVVERLHSGIVVKFEDETCAFYSAALLRSMLFEAEPLDESRVEW